MPVLAVVPQVAVYGTSRARSAFATNTLIYSHVVERFECMRAIRKMTRHHRGHQRRVDAAGVLIHQDVAHQLRVTAVSRSRHQRFAPLIAIRGSRWAIVIW
jgi:hypothetical protein